MDARDSETTDGRFIPGIYNYCDQWCSACRFATRCRLVAMEEARQRAPPRDGLAAQVRYWFRRVVGLTHPSEEERIAGDDMAIYLGPHGNTLPSVISLNHARLVIRARGYGDEVRAWQRSRPPESAPARVPDPAFPPDVIDHFALMIGAKVGRAVRGASTVGPWAELDRDDANGSAKAAILAAERSRDAWRDLRDSGLATEGTITTFDERLTWIIGELDFLFPLARAFVRPGFDEPP